MTQIDDGGPAFPSVYRDHQDNIHVRTGQSYRQYVAAQVMPVTLRAETEGLAHSQQFQETLGKKLEDADATLADAFVQGMIEAADQVTKKAAKGAVQAADALIAELAKEPQS